MRKTTTIVLGLSGAALALTASSAFTATGLTSNAGASAFIGGSAEQLLQGGTLSSISYDFADTANLELDEVTLTFADTNTDGKTPTLTVTGTGTGGWTCEAVGATTAKVSVCEPTTSGNTYTAVSKVEVAVV